MLILGQVKVRFPRRVRKGVRIGFPRVRMARNRSPHTDFLNEK